MEVNKAFWNKINKEFGNTLQRQIINNTGYIALRFSKQRFIKKNWIDNSLESWKPRKRKARGQLLVQTGRLKRSIRIIKKTPLSVTIGTDSPYAKIHNEGGNIRKKVQVSSHNRRRRNGRGFTKVKSHTRNINLYIPKRQFIGESKALVLKIERKMNKLIINTVNNKL